MIDITDSVFDALDGMACPVYRLYPLKRVAPPYLVIGPVGRSTVDSDADGSEISARVTYQADAYAQSMRECDAIISDVSDRLSRFSMHATGSLVPWDPVKGTYRLTATFSCTVDRRGDTYA